MKPSMVVRAVPASNGKTRLEIAGNPFFEVNAVAPTIWAKLVDGLSTQEIIDHLVRQFGVPEERVSSDVGNFIAILKEHLLISDDPELARLVSRSSSYHVGEFWLSLTTHRRTFC